MSHRRFSKQILDSFDQLTSYFDASCKGNSYNWIGSQAVMKTRDPLKGRIIGRVMAKTGCSYDQAEVVYVEWFEKRVLKPAIAIVAGMAVRLAYREVMGTDLPERN